MPGRVIALAVGLLVALVLSMAAGYAIRGAQTASPSVTGGQGVAASAPGTQNSRLSQGERQPTHGQLP
jgi:hypothetical protein